MATLLRTVFKYIIVFKCGYFEYCNGSSPCGIYEVSELCSTRI